MGPELESNKREEGAEQNSNIANLSMTQILLLVTGKGKKITVEIVFT